MKRAEREVVAWLHKDQPTAYVITDRIKQMWLRVRPRQVQSYTIPLCAANARAKRRGK